MVTTRAWLRRTVPELVDTAESGPADAQARCNAVAKTIDHCVSLGRFDVALRLSDWLVSRYVPRGDALSSRIVMGASALCADLGQKADLNRRAIRSLRRTAAAVPRGGPTELEWALCTALTDLGTLHTTCRTAHTWRRRTRKSIKVCDAIVARWSSSQDAWLRMNAAGAMLNKAMSLLELRDEAAARREYVRVIESFSADAARGGEAEVKIGDRLLVARHALEILDSMRLPEPEFNTGYIDAVKRQKRQERRQTPWSWLLRWLFMPGTRVHARQYLDAARRLHHRTAEFVRHASCVGEPWVLVLRNFELTFTTFARDSEHIQIAASPVGLGVMNKLFEVTNVVQVANTKAAALDLPTKTTEFLGHGRVPRLLYLPEPGWLDSVRVLVALAERIVIWAGAKSPALLQELASVTELGRTDDAVVLLDGMSRHHAFPDAPLPGEALTADDPVLAGFPTILQAREVRDDPDPFLHEVRNSIAAAQRLPMVERVALIRQRMGRLDQYG